jgi:hemolysin III
VTEAELRPRLRGVFHLWAFVVAVLGGTVLVALSDGPREMVSSWVYGAALAAMFGASALYHRFPWKSTARRLWPGQDPVGRHMLLATFTPTAPWHMWRTVVGVVLVLVWAGAALGLALELVWIDCRAGSPPSRTSLSGGSASWLRRRCSRSACPARCW